MSERGPRIPVGSDRRPVGRDVELNARFAAYQDAAVRASSLDAVTTELVRLRCARQHDCRICQTLRLGDAAEAGLDDAMTAKIDRYEQSDLSERHKVALRLVDAMIWSPSTVSPELAAEAHAHFSDEELAELIVDVTKWSTQKIHVTLGTDGADHVPVDERGVAYLRFDTEGRAVVVPTLG